MAPNGRSDRPEYLDLEGPLALFGCGSKLKSGTFLGFRRVLEGFDPFRQRKITRRRFSDLKGEPNVGFRGRGSHVRMCASV